MLTLGILLTFVTGLFLIRYISDKFTLSETIGLAFPVGLGVQTLLMLLIDAVGIRLSALSVGIVSLAIIAATGALIALRVRKNPGFQILPELSVQPGQYNLVWLLFVALIVYFEYMNFSKCMYFPVYDKDSIAVFDPLGFMIAREGCFGNLSFYHSSASVHGPGSHITYTPMLHLSYAYVYLFGATTSKIIPGLLFLSFLIAFYSITKRIAGRTCAAIATFCTMITPEMIAFSSLSATNVMHMIFASLGIIYIAVWLKRHERHDLYIGSVLLAINLWMRTEGVVFIGAAFCMVAIDALLRKQYRTMIPVAAAFLPALIWTAFMKLNGLYAESIAITRPFWDGEKAGTIYRYMKLLYTNTTYYGWTFVAFIPAIVLNIIQAVRKKDNFYLAGMILLAAFAYALVLYQIDYKWDSMHNVLSYSAKRFLFCFVPCVWYYLFSQELVVKAGKWIDNYLCWNEKINFMKKNK